MIWEEQAYSRKDENGNIVSLEEYNATHRPTGIRSIMTGGDLKLYLICGTGFFIDAYDLFIINLVSPIWQYEYWGGLPGFHHQAKPTYPLLLRGAVNAAANIGNVIGQIMFGALGDVFGRKFVYGKEMIIAIIGIILVIALPNSIQPTHDKFWWLFGFRILMGIGIGGDYPMSAAIVAERSTLQNRGRMLGFIFSNQGWGTLGASLVTLILLGCFSAALKRGEYGQLDAIWRLQIGLALVPSLAVLYFRLTMPESRKYIQSTELTTVNATAMSSSSTLDDNVEKIIEKEDLKAQGTRERHQSVVEALAYTPKPAGKWRVFGEYFSEWRHLKMLIGTASTWFLVDISFYGINLNQSVLLSDIGFSRGSTEYHTLVIGALGNLIIVVAGYLPGYFLTIGFIELLGRKWIQIQGFLVTALMLGVIAGDYVGAGTGGKFACFVFLQLFFNFGPNATTFIVPAECFPSRVRGLAHGISAAVGKLGAILSGVLFNYLANSVLNVPKVLWIFFAVNLAGAFMTLLFVPETKGIDADAIDYEECQARVAKSAHL